jgi:hypothetical protein
MEMESTHVEIPTWNPLFRTGEAISRVVIGPTPHDAFFISSDPLSSDLKA